MASSPAPPGHHDERHESTSSSADDDEITAAAEASPEQGGGGGGGRGTGGSGSAATEGDQKGKGKVVEGSQEAAKKDKVDSQLKKFIRRSFLAVSEGFKKKLSDRQGKQLDEASTSNSPPHVDHKKIPMEEAVYHYFGDIHNVLRLSKRERESVIIMRLVPLHSHYSALRPVYRDGESFYRSFIFSYLEQIVDRVDMGEEDRLLAAVRELARRAEHFQWASEFPRRREAFEKLIEKIKGWKRMLQYPTLRVRFLKRYNRGEFLLEFFSSYDTTDDIFAFLRLAAAIWMCSPDHITMYAPGVIGPGEGRSLEDWCSTQVIPPRVYADEVAVRALAAALQVFIRVEAPEYGGRQDSYYIARDRPRVTLLRMDSQYDIVYPLSPELIHQRAKRGGASRFYCCIGGDSNLQRLSQQQEERGGGGQAAFLLLLAISPATPLTHASSCPASFAASMSDGKVTAASRGQGEASVGRGGSTAGGRGVGTVEEARRKEKRKSGYPKEKLLESSMRSYQGPAKEEHSDREGEQPNSPSQNSRSSMSKSFPQVFHKKLPMGDAVYYYFKDIYDALRIAQVGVRLIFLDHDYSEFRPVVPDEECFYRSFIFSYLEQVVDRIDTLWEDRLLAALRELDRRAERFQRASEFSRRRKVFVKLIAKIKGWKRMRDYPPSRVSYSSVEFLLEFFSSYDSTNDSEKTP
ncbi:hypothetical protein OsJ_06950 [Oryza sativa Japonica Group]|uniref:Uncharacterized protein n=1 Tax=Oryza sativa subsp. japonica TaxID=39947 RepID=B9F0B0_ORYSJ|nr:hypothetical protein OsJ_06950 [Oryza sativa Japonica Group]